MILAVSKSILGTGEQQIQYKLCGKFGQYIPLQIEGSREKVERMLRPTHNEMEE